MINDIINYINFLKAEYKLNISIHSVNSSISAVAGKLAPYNIHYNPYCLYIKSNKLLSEKCILWQKKVINHCNDNSFFGCCYAGVCEYVIPIKNNDEILGFISVSGYRTNESMSYISAVEHEFPSKILKNKYTNYLSNNIPDKKFIETLIKPLSSMLVLLHIQNPKSKVSTGKDYIYGHIMAYIYSNYHKKIKIQDIANLCHCSQSYVSHIFKEKCGKSISSYVIDYRIAQAKLLLKNSDISIDEIGFTVGFNDSNYFISTFSKTVGISPKKYRNKNS